MSFSTNLKEEIASKKNLGKLSNIEKLFELYGMIFNTITKYDEEKQENKEEKDKEEKIKTYTNDIEAITFRFSSLISYFDIPNKVIQNEKNTIVEYNYNMLKKHLDNIYEQIDDEKNFKQFFIGLFESYGTIADPNNRYMLKITVSDPKMITYITNRFKTDYEVTIKVLKENKTKIYNQETQGISNILAFMGATKSKLFFEDVLIQKEMNKKMNAIANGTAYNISKSVDKSVKTIAIIEKIKALGNFEKMPDNLKQTAKAREQHPEFNMQELADYMGINKTTLAYRIKRFEDYL